MGCVSIVDTPQCKIHFLMEGSIAMASSVFNGYEAPRYQEHDALITQIVAAFNADKATFCGATADQAAQITDLTEDLVKAWIIQETGGGDAASLAGWAVDPAQVNNPGDWSEWKPSAGLTQPQTRNSGDIETNLKAAVIWLARKGFGTSGQPPANRPTGTFDGWPTALRRYNGNVTPVGDLEHRDIYAQRVVQRESEPRTCCPIEIMNA